uniref:Uncharacterized protein n=1 Tax=Tanacetum cinerariifolium TaxID=118510 RepID=A0A699KCH4_TANCI|nr:hypothetical protein [Tanacetum cinerariifolium]
MNGLEVAWERYSDEVLQRFRPIVEDPMVDLKNLKQTSTIKTSVCFRSSYNFRRDDEEFSGEEESLVEEFSHVSLEQNIQITLNALFRITNFSTMRVKGQANRQPVHILVDCGSTHKGCDLKATCPLQISMAGRSQFVSQYVCKSFKWKLQGETFESDFMILPLVLRGTRQSELQWMQGRPMSKQLEGQGKEMYYVWPFVSLNLMWGNNQQLQIHGLLEEFNDVIAIPTCLPPN